VRRFFSAGNEALLVFIRDTPLFFCSRKTSNSCLDFLVFFLASLVFGSCGFDPHSPKNVRIPVSVRPPSHLFIERSCPFRSRAPVILRPILDFRLFPQSALGELEGGGSLEVWTARPILFRDRSVEDCRLLPPPPGSCHCSLRNVYLSPPSLRKDHSNLTMFFVFGVFLV